MKLSSQNAYRLIRQFEEAVRRDEFSGAAHPDDRDAIQADYERRKAKLEKFVIECLLIPSEAPTRLDLGAGLQVVFYRDGAIEPNQGMALGEFVAGCSAAIVAKLKEMAP